MNNLLFTKSVFYRNFKDYKFTNKLTAEKQTEIIEKLSGILKDFEFIKFDETNEKITKFLNKNYVDVADLNRMFINEKSGVIIQLFGNEHIKIFATGLDCGQTAYKKVKEIVDLLANSINLAYQDNFGYLMSDITKIGTGLNFESEISLPCVEELGKIEQIKTNLKKLGYELQKTNHKHVYKLQTLCNLGKTEKEILENNEKMLKNLQDIETESAKILDIGSHDEIVDKAYRSLAILKSAYLLTSDELNSLLTNLRIGLNLSIFEIEENKIHKLQGLAYNKNSDFVSQSELKKLAQKVQEVLKGE